jgi:hypothetical protein
MTSYYWPSPLFESPLTEWARGSNLLSGWTPALDIYEDEGSVFMRTIYNMA